MNMLKKILRSSFKNTPRLLPGYFVRTISDPTAWPDGINKAYNGITSIPLSTVCSDFKTKDNTLSWWYLENTSQQSLEELSAALISLYQNEEKGKINLIIIPAKVIMKRFDIIKTPEHAHTAIISARDRHYDMRNMDLAKLNQISIHVAKITSHHKRQQGTMKRINFESAILALSKADQRGDLETKGMAKWIKQMLPKC